MKNQWKKPELVVIIRGKNNEAVLQGCKGNDVPIGHSLDHHDACHSDEITCTTECRDIYAS